MGITEGRTGGVSWVFSRLQFCSTRVTQLLLTAKGRGAKAVCVGGRVLGVKNGGRIICSEKLKNSRFREGFCAQEQRENVERKKENEERGGVRVNFWEADCVLRKARCSRGKTLGEDG